MVTHLQVLLSVEHDALGFHFAVFNVDFVASQNDGNIFADANQISVPVGDIFVCDA